MPFNKYDRVRLLVAKTYGGKTIVVGTLGAVESYSSLDDSCNVTFDQDSFIRLVPAADLTRQ